MTQNEGAGPFGKGHGPGYEQRGQGFSIRKIAAEARDRQAARRRPLRSAVALIRRRRGGR